MLPSSLDERWGWQNGVVTSDGPAVDLPKSWVGWQWLAAALGSPGNPTRFDRGLPTVYRLPHLRPGSEGSGRGVYNERRICTVDNRSSDQGEKNGIVQAARQRWAPVKCGYNAAYLQGPDRFTLLRPTCPQNTSYLHGVSIPIDGDGHPQLVVCAMVTPHTALS